MTFFQTMNSYYNAWETPVEVDITIGVIKAELEDYDLVVDHFDTLHMVSTMKVPKILDKTRERELSSKICGGSLPDNFDFENMGENIIEHPKDGIVGLINLPYNDFIILDSVERDPTTIVEFCKDETELISHGKIGGRAGAAGGRTYSTTNSHSVKGVSDGQFHLSPEGCSSMITYYNEEDEVVTFRAVYNDIYMNRMGSRKKLRAVKNSFLFCDVVLTEMVSRLKCMLLALSLGVIKKEVFNHFKTAY